MDHNKFETPVTVKDDTASAYITLKTTHAASDFLLNRWQAKRTDKHRAALQACSDVIGGNKPVIVARRALVAAVREAGVYVDEKTLAGG
jgi:hypothetical protein